MELLMKHIKKAFTLIELVVVIAVIAVLSAVSIVSYVSVTKRAKESNALVEAMQAWTEVSAKYLTYSEFVKANGNYCGWYFDYVDDIAKFDTKDGNHTVTFNGKEYKVHDFDKTSVSKWDAITQSTIDFPNVSSLTAEPYGLKLSYNPDIFSRGFAWSTVSSVTESQLYVVKSNKGENADFSSSQVISGTSSSHENVTTHKASISNLSPSTTYSYKVGSSSGWAYGVFRTESSNPESITAIQISDAQTKYQDLLYCWENTFAQSIETSGRDLDMVIYNGDQYDVTNKAEGSYSSLVSDSYMKYSIAVETIKPYLKSIPYMAVAGNHDRSINNSNTVYYENNSLNFAGSHVDEVYYSYDYGNAHFVMLNSYEASFGNPTYVPISANGYEFSVDPELSDQASWLVNDLISARSRNMKWIIVSMHVGPHSTGDHSADNQTPNVTKSFTPIFSTFHVDLVFQAHDHTYSKTLPYKWDSVGYTTSYNNSEVVNFSVVNEEFEGVSYDKNPMGTYYVTTGAAGQRFGEAEGDKSAGLYADVNHSTGEGLHANSYRNNFYKTEVGRIKYSNSYESFVTEGLISNQTYNQGDPATGNVNANMFGVLNIENNLLRYDFYTVRGNEVRLFDSVNIMKTL